jgi:3-hydroxyisobutyrate dehydrogenase-like beta-hydroxyacid dehydrogenase
MSDSDVAEIHHPSRPVIGVVGLGAMGGQIAGRLLSQGNLVYGTNRTKAKADPLIGRGLRWRDTPRQVTETADVIISMVTDSDALQAVTGGLAGVQPGKIYLVIRLALDTAHDLAVPLPSTPVADELLDAARAHGYQHRHISVLLQLLGDLTPAAAGRPNHAFATA